MKIEFYKYQGTGNDFVILDNRTNHYSNLNQQQIELLCNRRFGIGADGLMMLNLKPGVDFEMLYFNADGKPGSMCGNGGRCMVHFANKVGLIKNETKFLAYDGIHTAKIFENEWIHLSMNDVKHIEKKEDAVILNTGSPHYVKFVENLQSINVFEEGKKIRYSDAYAKEGINVNFVEVVADKIFVRTYERGVEKETLSCGTGVTASAIASVISKIGVFEIDVEVPGGKLKVLFQKHIGNVIDKIFLIGPANFVFSGTIEI